MENIKIDQHRIKKRERTEVTASNLHKKSKIHGSMRRSQRRAALTAEAAFQPALAGDVCDDDDDDSSSEPALVEVSDTETEDESEELYEESQRQSSFDDSTDDECCGAAECIPASQKGKHPQIKYHCKFIMFIFVCVCVFCRCATSRKKFDS